jgi:hypothetical protein
MSYLGDCQPRPIQRRAIQQIKMLQDDAPEQLYMLFARSNRNLMSRCTECRTIDAFERRRNGGERMQTNDRQKQGDNGS